ncbi:hypothetical protein SDC9_95811 [bioreactor metagenome]|uniref:Metallopeptidase family protein n=1 Tax=bioreactor metagenome TaxID=1076179 RepID=A0A645AE20_9ZZZZ
MLDISAEQFEAYVDAAVESVPPGLLDLVENCILVIEDDPPAGEPYLLGYYQGVPLDRRGNDYSGVLPDRILIFRNPLMRICRTPEELREQVRITVVHEIGHFFGMDDARLHELGYA